MLASSGQGQGAASRVDALLRTALDAVRSGPDFQPVLDELPVAVYTTDAQGRLTYFNPACIDFSGRTPRLGADSWCVSWKLYTKDGVPLPHEECPMAVAIREKREIRGAEAVAERPDGTRVTFRPYPTPLIDGEGELVGALNLLLDISAAEQASHFREQARRCRRLAASVTDAATAETLRRLSTEYEAEADSLAPQAASGN